MVANCTDSVLWPGRIWVADTSGTAMARSRHIDEAAALLVREGPAGGGRRYALAEVERVAHVSRSTVNRLWPTVRDLADDVALHAACHRPGWLRDLVAHDPAAPLAEAVVSAMGAPTTGVLFRAALRAGGTSAPTAALRAWEGDGLVRLERWLARHLAAHGRAPAGPLAVADLALVLAAHLEGWSYLHALRCAPAVRFEDGLAEAAADAAARALRELTTPSGRPHHDAMAGRAVALAEEPADRRTAVLEAVVAATETVPFGLPGGPQPTRLVDLARLARAAGVSVRRAQMIWPTTTAENADLCTHVKHAMRASVEDLHRRNLDTISHATGPAPGGVDDLTAVDTLVALAADTIALRADPAFAGPYACSLAVADPTVARCVQVELAEAEDVRGVLFLAAMQLLGYQVALGTSVASFANQVHAVALGGSLLGLLHPELLRRTTPVAGRDRPVLALGVMAALRAATDAHDRLGPLRWWRAERPRPRPPAPTAGLRAPGRDRPSEAPSREALDQGLYLELLLARMAAAHSALARAEADRRSAVGVVAVDVGLAGDEADALVEAVCGLAAGPAGEVDGAAPELGGQVEGGAVHARPHPLALGGGIDHDVLDPRPHAGGDPEHHEREGPEHHAVLLRQQEVAGRRLDHGHEVGLGDRRGRAGQLRDEPSEDVDQAGGLGGVGDLADQDG